jgi:hypothetical protein
MEDRDSPFSIEPETPGVACSARNYRTVELIKEDGWEDVPGNTVPVSSIKVEKSIPIFINGQKGMTIPGKPI